MRAPFFIVGCGRSGTSLLRSMLNRHPHVAVPLESLFILDYLRLGSRIPVARLRSLLTREYEIREWGISIELEDLRECETPRELVEKVHVLYAKEHGKSVWGQKTPRFVRHGELLKAVWPSAKFVHIIRDPRAVVSSLIRSNVHRSNAYYASRRWVGDVLAGRALKKKYPEDVLEIFYEDLVKRPREVLGRVCAFLGLTYDPGMLNYEEQSKKEYAGKYYEAIHANLKAPPNPDRASAWRSQLTTRQLSLVESICGDLMERVGYERSMEACAPSLSYITFLKLERVMGLAAQMGHYLLYRPQYLVCNLRRKIFLSKGNLLEIIRNVSAVNY